MGINNKTSKWIGAWLSHRFQRVVVDGHTSNSCHVLSGIQIGAKVIQLIASTSCVIFIFRFQHKKIMDSGVYLQNHVSNFFENKKHVLCVLDSSKNS
jgi:hypothetical protein